MTVNLTPAEYAATKAKIDKINARAAKRGFTGRFEITGKRVEVTSTNDVVPGFEVTCVMYKTTITGAAPRYNGWTFLARVDAIGDTFTLATAGGVEHIDREFIRPRHCDHCKSNRARKTTYLVVNHDGEIMNVGSTCIKDFLGWDGNFVFISQKDVEEDLFGRGHGAGEQVWTVDSVLAAAHAATRAFGWKPSGFGWSTAQVVRLLIGAVRPTEAEREALVEIQPFVQEARERAAIIKAWVLSDDFAGSSTYVDNLKAAASVAEVGPRQIGLLASAPNAYARHLETAAERAAREAAWDAEKAARTRSVFLGQPGDRIEFKGTISAIRYLPNNFGTTVLYTIATAEGNLVKWFASREALGDAEGVEVHLVGTVKDHDEYQGQKSTIVTRCKPVKPKGDEK